MSPVCSTVIEAEKSALRGGVKFLIDAHLPPGLRAVIQAAGHDAIHTLDLPEQNASRDEVLNEVSMADMRVVVTKDTDFYYSHLLHGRPWKLVLVRTGNLGLKATLLMFDNHLAAIEAALQTHTLVELDQKTVTIVP